MIVKNIFVRGLPLIACCGSLIAAPLTLVDDSKPLASLVVAANDPQAAKAAAEIQKYVQIMSGATLAIVEEGQSVDTPVTILIGHTSAARELGVTIPSGFDPAIKPDAFEEEGFVIKTLDQSIILGGNSDGPYQGTLYAGYDFLERLGCRWFFPGDWGQVIPQTKTVVFPETDVISKPDFALRHVSLGGWFPATAEECQAYADWETRNKYTPTGQPFYPLVGDGFLGYLLPPKEYPDEPTLYAMNESRNREQPADFLNGVMLSLHNPRVFELSVQNLKKAMAGSTDSAITRIISPNGFGISPPDGTAFDYDPDAVALNGNFNYPNYVQHPMTSQAFFRFAGKLANEFPDKWVATMAYAGREMPPQGIEIPKNMSVMYAPIATCVLHPLDDPSCWRRQETARIMEQWTRLTPHVYLYDYNPGLLLGGFVPERDVANFAVNVKKYRDMGLKGFQAEGRKTFMITWISYYMRGKLMWDADADVQTIKTDFYNTFFGPAAGPLVQQWWDECETALADTTMHCHEDWLLTGVYTVELTQRLHSLVEQAAACEMTPAQKARFDAFALIADHLEAFAARNEAEKQLDYAEAIKQAQRMEADTARLIEISSFFIGPKEHPDFNNGWMKRYEQFAKMTNGQQGALVAPVPLEAPFQRDPYNEGVIAEWYAPAYDDATWKPINTFETWDAQDPPEDSKGHDYDGYGWYRFTVDVPANAIDKPLKLHLGGVLNEGWVWVNGKYVGHRDWKLWWAGREALEMDADLTGTMQAGKNVIAIRVWNSSEHGGLIRRGFVWSPNGGE